ncbi:hypothetical protein NIES4075_35290 [Tolypothrix sp. NIES-4075]|uniref:KGK domain-containing protein n=1 Tax=Tolypothrix sp. NIES-4075 TaxID=2005459 RepID=UPI000B5CAADA|nr:KGK domain-containing protein [Tolypothrix sp. NIES-4075]GAX42528.1 hypothetical protein NIES4075_35290 [Tolypothrix sp. NIES-4075]
MGNGFESMESEDAVLSILKSQQRVIINNPMFKMGELLRKMKSKVIDIDSSYFEKDDAYVDQKRWLNEGVDCEILKPGGYWKRGKLRVRVTLEFCPDEPESPLDDLRQQLKQIEHQ